VNRRGWIAAALVSLCLSGSFGCADAADTATPGREPVVGLPCDGCEAVFDGLPAQLESSARIAPRDEPGQPLRIEGTVRDANGRPAEGVIVYAYHTDDRGIYPAGESAKSPAARRHGRLRAWVKTGKEGRYRFDTIRPAGYPDTNIAQHVHMHVIEVGRCTYYIDDIHFEDDPRLTPAQKRQLDTGRGGRGGPGLAMPRREGDGWVVTRDIVLGAGIPGYPVAAPK
jgi:hypothetical protein